VEIFLQYLDDLDDLYGMAGLIVERLRRAALALMSVVTLFVGALSGIWLATLHVPLALATGILLFVTLLYRSVTSPSGRWTPSA